MSYVDSNLLPGEIVVKRGVIHWYIFTPGLFLLIVGMVILQKSLLIGGMLLVFGFYYFFKAFITFISTELVITSQRVIAKFGFISRTSIELSHNKVGSMLVEQSIMGRILNFGTVIVGGYGGAVTPIRNIQDPLGFRRVALSYIEGNPLNSPYPPET
jgi:uncharacterized membrane protein YdbT with pleckstrin-like domain